MCVSSKHTKSYLKMVNILTSIFHIFICFIFLFVSYINLAVGHISVKGKWYRTSKTWCPTIWLLHDGVNNKIQLVILGFIIRISKRGSKTFSFSSGLFTNDVYVLECFDYFWCHKHQQAWLSHSFITTEYNFASYYYCIL